MLAALTELGIPLTFFNLEAAIYQNLSLHYQRLIKYPT